MRHASVDKAKRYSENCRNHGACSYCRGSRTWQDTRNRYAANMEIAEMSQTTDEDLYAYATLTDPHDQCKCCSCGDWIGLGDLYVPSGWGPGMKYCAECGQD